MKTVPTYFLIFVLFCTGLLLGQNSKTFNVKDESGYPIPYVEVEVLDSEITAISDENGVFTISLPPNRESAKMEIFAFLILSLLPSSHPLFSVCLFSPLFPFLCH